MGFHFNNSSALFNNFLELNFLAPADNLTGFVNDVAGSGMIFQLPLSAGAKKLSKNRNQKCRQNNPAGDAANRREDK